ncbi:hypothetical protein [Methylosinus sp. LW3]|uniref:hypothetical protein n=1 Tax=Methylosinus sp. LW3 TaxID=107635 RepID=UPI0004648F7A|nr:hypothetical protein [Methylosinus sp. LW3]
MLKAKLGFSFIVAFALTTPPAAFAQEISIWRRPSCGCCHLWAKRLDAASMKITMIDANDIETCNS